MSGHMASQQGVNAPFPFKRYDTEWMGVGKRLQRLDTQAGKSGDPWLTTPFSRVEEPMGSYFQGMSKCCEPEQPAGMPEGRSWIWTKEGKLRLSCEQPIVPVPIVQEIQRRDRIIEIPHVEVLDAVQPKIYNQGVQHQVATAEIVVKKEEVAIPQLRYREKEVIVPLVTGYTHKFVPKWEIREVPRPVVKYTGEQKIIEIEVPQIRFVDKIIEREVVIDTVEKKVPKIIEIENEVETVQYVWKPIEKIVEIETIVPKFDVSLECPSPLLVPYPVKQIREMPSVMVRKPVGKLEPVPIEWSDMPPGTIRVPVEYIDEYSKASRTYSSVWPSNCMDCCMPSEVIQQEAKREIYQEIGQDLSGMKDPPEYWLGEPEVENQLPQAHVQKTSEDDISSSEEE